MNRRADHGRSKWAAWSTDRSNSRSPISPRCHASATGWIIFASKGGRPWRRAPACDLPSWRESPAYSRGAQYVDFSSFDSDYHESWDIDSAMHPQTLVVYAQDGHYLNAAWGAPARIYSPVKLGYKNTKYLTRITFLPRRNGGYWSDRGYEWYGGV